MPSSPKKEKYMLGLPARPSSGRRCHSQKRILFLFSLVLLVSSGSMVILHITSPFARNSLSCAASSSTSSSSNSAGCVAASRRTRWRPDRDEDETTSEGQEEQYRVKSPFRNHDRPRVALPRPADNVLIDGQEQQEQQQQQQQQQINRPAPSPVLPPPQLSPDQESSSNAGDLYSQHTAAAEHDDADAGQDQEPTGTTIESGNLSESPQLNTSNENTSDESVSVSQGSQEDQDDEDSRSSYDGEEAEEERVVEEPVILPFEETLDSEDDTKYLTYLPYAGITNQFYGMLRGMEVAKALDRTLIIPPITASSHDKSKQNQPWSRFFDLEKFSKLTGTKVVEFHQLRDMQVAEMNRLKCGITCGFGSKRTVDFTAKGFLKQWKFNVTLENLRTDPDKLGTIVSALRPYSNDKYLCVSNTYKISVKDKSEWERFGQHLHFTEELESFVEEFLDRNLVKQEGSPRHSYLAIHARRGDFAPYCEANFKGPKMIHCLPSTEQIAARIDTVQTRLNPKMDPDQVLPVFVATNERRPEELKKFADLGWRYLDHDEMGTVERLGIFGPMMVDQVFMAHAKGFVGIQMSTFSRVGALRQRDWHQRKGEYM